MADEDWQRELAALVAAKALPRAKSNASRQWVAKVATNGRKLETAPPDILEDPEVVLYAVQDFGFAMRWASEDLRKNKAFVKLAVQVNSFALKYADDALLDDFEVVLTACKSGGTALKYASQRLQAHPGLVQKSAREHGLSFQHASDALRSDRDFVIDVAQENSFAVKYAKESVLADPQFLEAAEQHGIRVLPNDPREWQLKWGLTKIGRGEALAMVTKDGGSLHILPLSFKGDKEIVMAAMQSQARAFVAADAKLREDPEVVLFAMRRDGLLLRYASERLHEDLDRVSTSIRADIDFAQIFKGKDGVDQYHRKLQEVSDKTAETSASRAKVWKEVVTTALQQNGLALEHAGEWLRNDRKIVEAAVSQNGAALRMAGRSIQKQDPKLRKKAEMATAKSIRMRSVVCSVRCDAFEAPSAMSKEIWARMTADHSFLKQFSMHSPSGWSQGFCGIIYKDDGTEDWSKSSDKAYQCRGLCESGPLTRGSCRRRSYRHHQTLAKNSGGFMIQIIERDENSGKPQLAGSQEIEELIATSLDLKVLKLEAFQFIVKTESGVQIDEALWSKALEKLCEDIKKLKLCDPLTR
mmetsp:Transcript_120565/g.257480  ORF Transcript_120565/g.257480 Transcript_120565/m.257480 type:complete len:583 (-) Transcript_120565:203-1951(-)